MSCLQPAPPPSPLSRFAAECQRGQHLQREEYPLLFPMYTVPLDTVLEMAEIRPHEAMLSAGELQVFDRSKGKAMFVSHQWIGVGHPDPGFQQFRVLQESLRNILDGTCKISVDMVTEALFGLSKAIRRDELRLEPLSLWYDYFCCPQSARGNAAAQLQHAIESIPSYVFRCDFFAVLCPPVESIAKSQVLNRSSWSERGWCRLEHTFWNVCSQGKPVIFVKGPRHQEVTMLPQFSSVAEGSFSNEEDRKKVGASLCQAVRNQLLSYLRQGEFTKYRVLLNLQKVYLGQMDAGLELVPGFNPPGGWDSNPQELALMRFLFQTGFAGPLEHDATGWSPLCYATLRGDATLVAALLEKRASPNDRTRRSNPDLYLAAQVPVLIIGARFQNHEAMKVLLAARANIDSRDSIGSTALMASALSKDLVGAQLLCNAGARADAKNLLGVSVAQIACEADALDVLKELRLRSPDLSLQDCLHSACQVHGSAALVRWLAAEKADMNQQMKPHPLSIIGVLLKVKGAQYRFGASRTMLGLFGFHHYGATPLMAAILTGNFEAAGTLVVMGAQLHVRNSRGRTALDLAREMSAPSYLVDLLEGQQRGFGLASISNWSVGALQWCEEVLPEEVPPDEESDYFEI